MKIDRNNYEEYFLLYTDNELSVDQKKQVDLFVKLHPDLEEELAILQQTKLVPDHSLLFHKKDLLMKNENDSFINLNNYQEWLLSYVDDELSEEEKMVVEKFAATHPQVQQELDLFHKTKLQPEEIVFPHKEILYRKERVAVISIQWWKAAVAAILIIAAGITLYSIVNGRNNNGVKGSTGNQVVIKKEQAPGPVKSVLPDKQKEVAPIFKEREQVIVASPVNKPLDKERKQKEQQLQKDQESTRQLAYDNTPVTQPQHATSEINDSKITETQINNTIVVSEKIHKENINRDSVTNQKPQTPQPIYASNTENKKLRGFFRKATRLIERTTNINPADDDNKVLIGGMAINLK